MEEDEMSYKYCHIHMSDVEGKPDHRKLDVTFPRFGDGPDIPAGFEWDGASVPRLFRSAFPKHRHPKASCGHDYDCSLAKNKKERKEADERFKRCVNRTSKIEGFIGFIGVRIGSFFGVGNNFGKTSEPEIEDSP